MRKRVNCLLIIVVCVLAATAHGAADEYLLAPGDVLQISVWGHPDLLTIVQIRPDGKIGVPPLTGDIVASGKSSSQLANELMERMKELIVSPRVTVVVKEFRTIQVRLFGEVQVPGLYDLKPESTISELLARAGGLTPEASISEIKITRNGQLQIVDFAEIIGEGRRDQFILESDDIVYVPKEKKALVLGEVNAPGAYTVPEGTKILDLLSRAGGYSREKEISITRQTNQSVMIKELEQGLGKAIVVRDTAVEPRRIVVDLQTVLYEPDSTDNVDIFPGDLVYFLPVCRQVSVLGAVNCPGQYTPQTGDSLLDMIAKAGGLRDDADGDGIIIGDESGEGIYSLARVASGLMDSPVLRPGCVVYVPTQTQQVLVLGEVRNPGIYFLPQGSRLLDAISLAGGVLPGASPDQITISRTEDGQDVVFQAEFHALTHQLALNTNYPIQEGDVIFVPEAKLEVVVLGQVKQPGMYSIGPDTRVIDAIAMAGGPTERAALQSVGIYRGADVSQVGGASLGDKLLFEGDVEKANPLVVGGDIIYVPETVSPDWHTIFQFLTGVKLFKDLATGW